MRVSQAFQRYRAFIFGYEVSADITNITHNCHDGRDASECTISLNNDLNKYVTSVTDLAALYEDISPELLAPPQPQTNPTEQLVTTNTFYTVVEGDTLGEIAAANDVTVKELLGFNPQFKNNPNLIFPGNQVRLPGRTTAEEVPQANIREQIRGQARKVLAALQANMDELPEPKRSILLRKVGILRDISETNLRRDESGKLVPDERVVTTIQDITSENFDLDAPADIFNIFAAAGLAPAYPIKAGAPIFNAGDPVTVFMNDPARPNEWYWAFRGKVHAHSKSSDFLGQKTLNIIVKDLRATMSYGRISLNPGVLDQTAGTVEKDRLLRTFRTIPLANLPLEEQIYNLLFGPELTPRSTLPKAQTAGTTTPESREGYEWVRRYSYKNPPFDAEVRSEGIGAINFERSATFLIGEAGREDPIPDGSQSRRVTLDTAANGREALQAYLAYTDTHVKAADLEDLDTGSAQSRRELLRNVDTRDINEVITFIGEHPERYPADGGRLFILLPASLGTANTEIFKLGITDVAGKTDFVNRLGLILDITDALDFSFFVDGRGDMHLEMPLRDFDPYDLGTTPITGARVASIMKPAQDHSKAFLDTLTSIEKERDFAPFADRHTFTLGDTASTSDAFDDSKIRSIFRTFYWATQLENDGVKSELLNAVIVKSPSLIAAYGPRAESSPPDFFFGANAKVARAAAGFYGLTELNKINAEADTASFISHPARPGLLPNRPIEVDDEGYIGTTRNVQYSWSPGGNPTDMQVNMNSLRRWSGGYRRVAGLARPPRFYAGIAGEVGQPLDYGERLGLVKREDKIPTNKEGL